ncbi:MAG: cupin domain-containing protein [Alphaproteobacteria bacterium]|nr:cupin domain-containing protein [Alphaproteobacteria bacterium]
MECIKKERVRVVRLSDNVTVHEYDTVNKAINGGIAKIHGRYPSKGHAMNLECKELVCVLDGEGMFLCGEKKIRIAPGDVVLVDAKEKYVWQGELTLFMATTPAFDPSQHITTD